MMRNVITRMLDGPAGINSMMVASTIRGAQEQGVMVTIKHFVMINEQTNARSGIYCWASEQAMRELYLRPFEIAANGASWAWCPRTQPWPAPMAMT